MNQVPYSTLDITILTLVVLVDCFPSMPFSDQSLTVVQENFLLLVRVVTQPDIFDVLRIALMRVDLFVLNFFGEKPAFNSVLHFFGQEKAILDYDG